MSDMVALVNRKSCTKLYEDFKFYRVRSKNATKISTNHENVLDESKVKYKPMVYVTFVDVVSHE